MLSVVTWLWQEGFRDYAPEHVNTLARNIRRHLPMPHRFICVADRADGLEVEYFQTPAAARAVGELRSLEGARFPSCYRRLWMFSREAQALGPRVLLIDIDLIAVRDLSPIIEPSAEFVGWRPRMRWGNKPRVGGGIYLLTTGSRADVWEKFSGLESAQAVRAAGYRGSDQAWISYMLGATEETWSERAGIYSIRDIHEGRDPLPDDARLVQFNGPQKPWNTPLAWAQVEWR